jgi:hypothetical protein
MQVAVSTPQRRSVLKGQLLINGRWQDAAGGETIPSFDPTTEKKITDVAKASPADADQALGRHHMRLKKNRGAAGIRRHDLRGADVIEGRYVNDRLFTVLDRADGIVFDVPPTWAVALRYSKPFSRRPFVRTGWSSGGRTK